LFNRPEPFLIWNVYKSNITENYETVSASLKFLYASLGSLGAIVAIFEFGLTCSRNSGFLHLRGKHRKYFTVYETVLSVH